MSCSPVRGLLRLVIAIPLMGLCAACHRDMYEQPRYDPLEPSTFFDDGRSARPLVEGTIARGQLRLDDALYTGRQNGQLVTELPLDFSRQLLERGQERFNIFCSNCHGMTGQGDGMIVRRGYRAPPSYHTDRLRGVPIGHFFDVITNGFGVMPSYAHQISVEDRWAIAAYVRTLQLSQHATRDDLTPEELQQLENGP